MNNAFFHFAGPQEHFLLPATFLMKEMSLHTVCSSSSAEDGGQTPLENRNFIWNLLMLLFQYTRPQSQTGLPHCQSILSCSYHQIAALVKFTSLLLSLALCSLRQSQCRLIIYFTVTRMFCKMFSLMSEEEFMISSSSTNICTTLNHILIDLWMPCVINSLYRSFVITSNIKG